MAHVFISYAHEDGDFGDVLINKLKEQGITHWVDSQHLRAGEDWRQAIDDAIRNSFALIVVMSPAAKASEYVTYEWAFAWGLGVTVLPVLYKQTDLHPRLEALQYLDFSNRNARPWNALFEVLMQLESGYIAPTQSKSPLDAGTTKLIEDLVSSNSEVRRRAITALGNIREQSAVPFLIEIVQADNSWGARRDAIDALVKIGNPTISRVLIRTLHSDTSINVRTYAAWGLGELKSKEAVESLMEMLERASHRELDIQKAAVVALRKIADKSVTSRLITRMRYSEISVCARIMETLGYFGETGAVDAMTAYLTNTTSTFIGGQSRRISDIAAEALERIGTPEALAAVEEWRKQKGEANG